MTGEEHGPVFTATVSKPYMERVDADDEYGSIRYEIHSAHAEDGWMIVFDERNDRYAKQHADMMMLALLAIWPKQFDPQASRAILTRTDSQP